ncbi:MAG: thiamine phosphate synthase [Lautropia sp.]
MTPAPASTQNRAASAPARQHAVPARARVRGLYAVTPDGDDLPRLLGRVEACVAAGVRLLQYRDKAGDARQRRRAVDALQALCDRHDCLLVVNDDWELARDAGCRAVHLGADDGDVERVRDALGPDLLIGVSCYADLARAQALAPFADYLAFGSVFASPTKPNAPGAALAVLGEARAIGLPVVAIGGIGPENAARAIAAGADAVAVISAVFGRVDPGQAARELIDCCEAALAAAGR